MSTVRAGTRQSWHDEPCDDPGIQIGGTTLPCRRPVPTRGASRKTHQQHQWSSRWVRDPVDVEVRWTRRRS